MTTGDEIHNKITGPVGRSVLQIGKVYGDLVWHEPPTPQRMDESLRAPVWRLTREARNASTEVVRKWGISGPGALSVQWRAADDDLLDHWENVDDNNNEPVSLEGHFTAVRDTYQAVRSKRLVIVGQPGAGKTVLAHRLILDLLDPVSATATVPVLFSLSDWNPDSTDLRRWLTQQLLRDFGFLNDKNSLTGETQAEVLVKENLILPVLDGFDEISHQHHRAAITEISNIDCPLVITSRPEEYREAACAVKAVGRTAAIELQKVTSDEAQRYLRLSTSKSRSREWDAVFEQLETQPNQTASQNLTHVLTTPLMITLARTVYNDTPGHHPHALLDIQRFPSTTAVEDHLLDAYLDTVYTRSDTDQRSQRSPNWDTGRARRWLSHLAIHLTQRDTHDLTWWNHPATLRGHTRILITTATAGLVGAVAVALGALAFAVVEESSGGPSLIVDGLTYALMGGITGGIFGGIAAGLTTGLAVGVINELDFSRRHAGREPERLRLDFRRRSRSGRASLEPLSKFRSEFTNGLAIGFTVVLAIALVFAGTYVATPLTHLMQVLLSDFLDGTGIQSIDALAVAVAGGLTGGLVLGMTLGLVNVAVSALGATHDPHATDPWTLLSRDRTITLLRTTTTVLAVGITVGLMYGQSGYETNSTLGLTLRMGLSVGLLSGFARLALSAWGNWLLFTRLWLPLTGRLPWCPKRFLRDAHYLGVLRTTGGVYQFRHSRLRDHLADRRHWEQPER